MRPSKELIPKKWISYLNTIICSHSKKNLATKSLTGKQIVGVYTFRICPIGERALDLCAKQEDYLLEVLDKGAKQAQSQANETLHHMKEKANILRRLD